MRKRLEIGTDIAMIGIWDVAHERHDLGKLAGSSDFNLELESDARKGRLFFIYTGGDGSSDIELYVDEEPQHEFLEVYTQLNRKFLIEASSGSLVASGIEDFVDEHVTRSTAEYHIQVKRGSYSLTVHELKESLLESEEPLKKLLGSEDYAYYSSRAGSSGWFGCLTALIVILWLIAQVFVQPLDYWYVPVGAIVTWSVYRIVRRSSRDEKYESLNQKVNDYVRSFPSLVFVLTANCDSTPIKGGWYELH